MTKKYFVVTKGRKPGIYNSWHEARLQIKNFKNSEYKTFTRIYDAKEFLRLQLTKLSFEKNNLFQDHPSKIEHNIIIYTTQQRPYKYLDSINQRTFLVNSTYSGFSIIDQLDKTPTPFTQLKKYLYAAHTNQIDNKELTELKTIVNALTEAAKLNITKLKIYYQYDLSLNLLTSNSLSNNKDYLSYISSLNELVQKIQFDFVKYDPIQYAKNDENIVKLRTMVENYDEFENVDFSKETLTGKYNTKIFQGHMLFEKIKSKIILR